MEERPYGLSPLRLTRLGLGLAAVGRPAYITLGRREDLGDERSIEAMEARSHDVLDAAYAAGIRYFDAARSYGRAEAFLSSWLDERGIAPHDVTVGSKWGYEYVGNWRLDADVHEVKDHGLAMLRRQLPESRRLLGRWLRIYQVHSATFESGVLSDPDVLGELARLRADGLVVGITTTGPQQADVLRTALEVEVDGEPVFGSVQATWNLLEPSCGDALREAHDAGWGVIVKEALANGRLLQPDAATTVRARHGAHSGVPADAFALAAALANPWADVVLSGAATPEHVRSNVRALEVVLAPGELDALAELREEPAAYWAERSALIWT